MTDSALTPERIVAFLDGELPEAERRIVAAAIAADPEAQAMALQMRRGAAAAAEALAPALTAPLPARLTKLFARRPPATPLRGRSPRWRTAGIARQLLAATLPALVLGLVVGYWLHGVNEPLRPAGEDQADAVPPQFRGKLLQALDRGQPGESFNYAAPQTATTGRIIIVGELPTRSGLACREFRHVAEQAGAPLAQLGVACRSPSGGWETIILQAAPP